MKETNQLRKLMEAVEEPFIQAHDLSDDHIFDEYKAGNISYEEAEAQLKQIHKEPGDLEMAMDLLNTYYGDTEVDWDEESGGGVVREGAGYRLGKDSIGDRNTIKIIYNGKVLIEIDEHDWISLVNEYEGR